MRQNNSICFLKEDGQWVEAKTFTNHSLVTTVACSMPLFRYAKVTVVVKVLCVHDAQQVSAWWKEEADCCSWPLYKGRVCKYLGRRH